MRAVKSSPGPFAGQPLVTGVLPPGLVLAAFLFPNLTTAHASGSTRQAWGIASTVGKPETLAGVAKIVPQANDCRVCAAPSSIEG